jgi:hypothetical protein
MLMLRTALCTTAVAALVALPLLAQTTQQRVALPTSDELWGSMVAVEITPCCSAGTGQPGIAKAEAAVLEQLRDRASRDGPVLRLKLGGNRSLKITDFLSGGGADYRAHSLVAWWPRQGYYIVEVTHYDGPQSIYLVREADGLMLLVFAEPMLSPDEQHGVMQSPGSPGDFGLIDLVDIGANPPRLLPIALGPSCVEVGLKTVNMKSRWTDNATVEFGPAAFILGSGTAALRIVGDKAEWFCRAATPGSGERR